MENNHSAPLVSVVCDTFNQRDYIGQTIQGFLLQKTSFPVELIIHDDASTDGTADVIRRYAAEHPDLIRAVLRVDNMFSQDPKILEHYVFPLCRGKYTAICEGDDFWTDEHKLQMQVDYMEAHPDCTLCFHAAELVNADGKHLGWQRPYETDTLVPTADIIRGMGGFCPTASLMVPTILAQNRAAYCDLTTVDDAPLQIFFASRGTTYYMAQPMASYRVNAAGSWSLAQRKLGKAKRIALQESLIAMHEAFDADTHGEWHGAVLDALAVDRFEILWLNDDLSGMKQPTYRTLYQKLPFKSRMRLHVQTWFPRLYRRFRRD
ncbi:MAG: glycosyltransferase [Clostridia bacterium]